MAKILNSWTTAQIYNKNPMRLNDRINILDHESIMNPAPVGWWVVGVVRLSFHFTRFENARGEIKNQTENFFSTTPDRIEDDIGDEERDGEGA